MTLQKLCVFGLIVALLSGCASNSADRNDTAAGMGIGAVLGAVAGGLIGGSDGAAMGAALGAAVGGIIGSEIDKADEEKHQAALKEAFASGQSAQWYNSETGNSGEIDVVSRDTATGCMEVDVTVNNEDGSTKEFDENLCRDSDGNFT